MTRLLISLELFIVLSLISGCSASMVRLPGNSSDSQYAPINESSQGGVSQGGVVKYLNNGADFVIKSRREDAYKQMYMACHGRYRIVAEGSREEGGVVAPIGNGAAYYGGFQYWYIQFSCVE